MTTDARDTRDTRDTAGTAGLSLAGRLSRPSRDTQYLMLVGLLYLVARVITGVMLAVDAGRQVPTPWNNATGAPVTYLTDLAQWDGQWYYSIAVGGYPGGLPVDQAGVVQQNVWAFYPLFPILSRIGMTLTGASFPIVGSTLSLVFGLVAAVAMAVLLQPRLGRWAALLTVLVWASVPAALTLQVAYTESTAMALLVLYLLALSRDRWLVATGLAILIGLARPIAVPLALVTLVALWRRWRRRDERPVTRSEALSGLAALVGCGVAGLLWPAIAWAATGQRNAYTDTMGAWRSGHVITPWQPWVDISRYLFQDRGPVVLFIVLAVMAAMVLGPWARRLGPELRTWCLAYPAYLLVVLDPFTSVIRYLIPLFPLGAVMIGAAGPRQHKVWSFVRAGVLIAVFTVGQWYWIDELWRFVPPSDYPP